MFKKTMTFDDLDGNEVTETFYFNYNKKEVAELLEFGRILDFPPIPGYLYLPLEEMLAKLNTPMEDSGLSNRENNEQAYQIFQSLILDAYGEKVSNVKFEKSVELRNSFKSHVAFVELIFEFLGNTALAAQFIENCLPPKVVAQTKAELQKEGKLTEGTLAEMVEEADRRQKDPATRIEPGLENAPEHIQENARQLDGETKAKKSEELTADDIREMDDIAFKKLNPQKLSREAMLAAFERKNKG